jgi:hypothetical protein
VYSLSRGTVDRLNVFEIRIPRLRERREDIRTACRELSSSAGPKFGEGAGLKNRRLFAFSSRFPNRPIEKRAECAQNCAQMSVPKSAARRRYKALLGLQLASEGDGLTGVAFSASRANVSV